MARRMVERGVRFVQIYSGGMENQRSWDGHEDIRRQPPRLRRAKRTNPSPACSPISNNAVCSTIHAGDLGRRVRPAARLAEGRKPGRDHNPHAFTYWLAGGGVKAGVHHGQTDEIGFKAAVDRVSVNDLHATLLHLLGFDHERLTFRLNGRDFRLTDVAGEVVKAVVA
jgi:hypothetical protein